MSRNQKMGRWGEQAAADYLSGRGYEILARNVRTPHGEIDLIAVKDNRTVFVEVKARRTGSYGPPEVSVNARKQMHMIASSQYYAQQNGIDHWQLDVVAIERVGGEIRITHFENAVS